MFKNIADFPNRGHLTHYIVLGISSIIQSFLTFHQYTLHMQSHENIDFKKRLFLEADIRVASIFHFTHINMKTKARNRKVKTFRKLSEYV